MTYDDKEVTHFETMAKLGAIYSTMRDTHDKMLESLHPIDFLNEEYDLIEPKLQELKQQLDSIMTTIVNL